MAKRQAVTNPENTVFSVKRFMGRKFSEVAEETRRVPYRVVQSAIGLETLPTDATALRDRLARLTTGGTR